MRGWVATLTVPVKSGAASNSIALARSPYGPGWALVGDAGYNKVFITAQGIQDAFRDAELCATAVDRVFSRASSFDNAMAEYQSTRDAQVLPMYELTAEFASREPPSPELPQVLAAAHGNRQAMDGFQRVMAGMTSPAEFFSEENVERILAAAVQEGPSQSPLTDSNPSTAVACAGRSLGHRAA